MPVVPPAILNVITGFVIYHIIPSFLVLVEQAWIAELLWSMASDHKPNIIFVVSLCPDIHLKCFQTTTNGQCFSSQHLTSVRHSSVH